MWAWVRIPFASLLADILRDKIKAYDVLFYAFNYDGSVRTEQNNKFI